METVQKLILNYISLSNIELSLCIKHVLRWLNLKLYYETCS